MGQCKCTFCIVQYNAFIIENLTISYNIEDVNNHTKANFGFIQIGIVIYSCSLSKFTYWHSFSVDFESSLQENSRPLNNWTPIHANIN